MVHCWAQGNDGVLVVGATNRMGLRDGALLRKGRFDLLIYMGRPSTSNRFKILQARLIPCDLSCPAHPAGRDVSIRPLSAGRAEGPLPGRLQLPKKGQSKWCAAIAPVPQLFLWAFDCRLFFLPHRCMRRASRSRTRATACGRAMHFSIGWQS